MPMGVKYTASSIHYALEQAGCQVTTADTGDEDVMARLSKIATARRFDFVLGCKRSCLLKPFRAIRKREPDLPLLCWNMDSRPTIRSYMGAALAVFQMVDIMFTTAEGQLDEYRDYCQGRVIHLRQGCDPRIDNRFPLPRGRKRMHESVIFFAGDFRRKRDGRYSFFKALKRKYKTGMKLVGCGPVMIGKKHSLAVQCSKICIGWVADPDKQMRSQRDCKILGAGGFLLTRRGFGIERYFKLDEELVVFDTPGECLEKIEYYLAHPEERLRIADAGYKAAHERDTYIHRVQDLLAHFREWKDGTSQRQDAADGREPARKP